jgi:hypothetical protein
MTSSARASSIGGTSMPRALAVLRLTMSLERVTWLGLQKLEQILRLPTDRGDGNLLRAQTAAAGLAVNAQLRADETRMKQAPRRDLLQKIIAMIAEEKANLEDERRETEAATRTDIVAPSTCAEDRLPAQDPNDRA